MKIRPANKSFGFTLIELMVTMGLVMLVSGILIGILSQSSAMVSMGAAKIQLHQKSRNAVSRITPYLLTAVNGRGSGERALVIPRNKKDALTSSDLAVVTTVVFNTTEDFLNDNYNPDPQKDPDFATFDPLNDPIFRYEISFDDTDGRKYETSSTPVEEYAIGDVMLFRQNADGSRDNSVEPRLLASNVLFFAAYMITSNCLEIQVRTIGKRKGPQGNQIDEVETESAVIPLPSQSL